MTTDTQSATWADLDRRHRSVLDVTRRSKRPLSRPDTAALKQLLADLERYLQSHRSFAGAGTFIRARIRAHEDVVTVSREEALNTIGEIERALRGCKPTWTGGRPR